MMEKQEDDGVLLKSTSYPHLSIDPFQMFGFVYDGGTVDPRKPGYLFFPVE